VKDIVFQDLDLDLGEVGGVLKMDLPPATIAAPANFDGSVTV